MIRKRDRKPPLFYSADEIAAACPGGFYARLEAALAGRWEALAAPLRAAFVADWGRPTDPIVYLKCYLIGYFENITYDTDLAERIADSISLRTFLGYTLMERPPDHSSLSRVRAQVGEHCAMEEVLEAVVEACAKAGLVGGEVAAVDASLLPANAALSSLRSLSTGKPVREHLREVRARNRVLPEGAPQEPVTVSNAEFVSDTDPDAKIARKPGQCRGMYYRATQVVDQQHQIILAAECGRADVGEAEAARGPLTQAQETLAENEFSPPVVVADAGYDEADFHAHVEELGGTPLTNYQPDTRKPEGFRKADFRYDAEANCYLCPEGVRAHFAGKSKGGSQYRTRPGDCQDCPHRRTCIGEGRQRTLTRQEHEASRERNIARCHTEEGRALLKRRGSIVEAPFGHMKTYGGLGQINCRGLNKAQVKVVLAAVAWNLIKLVRAFFSAPAPPVGAEPPATGAVAVVDGSPLPANRSCPSCARHGQGRTPFWPRVAACILSHLRAGLIAEPQFQPLLR
jgi:hypothetical protein